MLSDIRTICGKRAEAISSKFLCISNLIRNVDRDWEERVRTCFFFLFQEVSVSGLHVNRRKVSVKTVSVETMSSFSVKADSVLFRILAFEGTIFVARDRFKVRG